MPYKLGKLTLAQAQSTEARTIDLLPTTTGSSQMTLQDIGVEGWRLFHSNEGRIRLLLEGADDKQRALLYSFNTIVGIRTSDMRWHIVDPKNMKYSMVTSKHLGQTVIPLFPEKVPSTSALKDLFMENFSDLPRANYWGNYQFDRYSY